MNIVLLSGGSGKRLWPLSNDIRSKQFVKMFVNSEGELESMVQRVYKQIKTSDPNTDITIATSKKQVSAIHNQLNDLVSVCVEPSRRDTFPAIALATAYLHSEKKLNDDEVIIVCPVDPYVEQDYFDSLKELEKVTATGEFRLNLMGVEPTYPSEKYGYIIPKGKEHISAVKEFKEKPTVDVAEDYIAQGALWNCGVFAFRLGYMMELIKERTGYDNYWDMYHQYETLEKNSFDYSVVEKESSICAVRFSGKWKDIGTWNTFAEEMSGQVIGNVILDGTCESTNVINELDIPILCMGGRDMIVAAGPDGILVSGKKESSHIKPLVDGIEQQVMFAEKSWGSFTVLDVQRESMTIQILLLPGHRLHYHSHQHRDEVWTVVSGVGKVILDDEERMVQPGNVIEMRAGCRHTIIADSELRVIEVQLGESIRVEDKVKFSL